MRILYINSLKSDYVQDQIFAGLTELLGPESVLSFPVNPQYYLPTKRYPRNMGLSRSAYSWFGDRLRYRKHVKAFEPHLVVIASTKRDTLESYLQIAEELPRGIPLVYIDGGDWPEVGGDAERMGFKSLYQEVFRNRAPDLVFKRECLIGKEYAENVLPLPMAFRPQQKLDLSDKRYQVTLWCVESDPIRTAALEMLQGSYDCIENGSIPGQTFRSYRRKGLNYLRELSASKIACNFRGVGWDTMRYWEIPAVGAFMVSQKPQIVIPNNFVDGRHVAFCRDDLTDFKDKLDYYLKHESEREELAAAAYQHLMTHHTHLHRASYFLEILRDRRIAIEG